MPSPKLGIIVLSLCVSIMVYLIRARKYLLIIIGRFAFFYYFAGCYSPHNNK